MSRKLSIRREQPKRRPWKLFAAGLAGALVGRLTDPDSGGRRRAEVRQRTAAFFRRGGRRAARAGGTTTSYAQGYAQRVTHLREEPKDYDDVTLARKIESEIFRPADVPKGQINVNVQHGVVQLRGEVRQPEMIRDLEEQVRKIQGVEDVENLLHVPGVEPQMHQ
jgi:BON domain